MHDDLKTYLINRLEVLDEEIGIKEREYRRIVKLLTEGEEMNCKCTKCHKELDESQFGFLENGRQYKVCQPCREKCRLRREEMAKNKPQPVMEEIKETKPAPKVKPDLDKFTKELKQSEMSYREYQIKETLRLAGMRKENK